LNRHASLGCVLETDRINVRTRNGNHQHFTLRTQIEVTNVGRVEEDDSALLRIRNFTPQLIQIQGLLNALYELKEIFFRTEGVEGGLRS
jgi:hypothetical protein